MKRIDFQLFGGLLLLAAIGFGLVCGPLVMADPFDNPDDMAKLLKERTAEALAWLQANLDTATTAAMEAGLDPPKIPDDVKPYTRVQNLETARACAKAAGCEGRLWFPGLEADLATARSDLEAARALAK